MKKITTVLSLIIVVALCAGTYSYAGPINRLHYAKNPTTLQDLKNVYGEPIHFQQLDGGAQKIVFAPLQHTMDLGYPFFIVKDGKVIDGGLALEYESAGTQQKEIDVLKGQITDIEKRMKALEK